MQLSLWGQAQPGIASGFSRLRRTELDGGSWVDYAPGFIAGHDALFERLEGTMRWQQEKRVMYEREVVVPRLFASAPEHGTLDPLLAQVGARIEARYGVHFTRVGMAHYRDGRDSVAWHRDHMPRDRETLVAILSLGVPRRFAIRPFASRAPQGTRHPTDSALGHSRGAARAFTLGDGDLLVMGGWCQRDWEHCVPKQAHAAPRMSCVFRHPY
jgi:alkylated DNA repair dioxygenase AlkB